MNYRRKPVSVRNNSCLNGRYHAISLKRYYNQIFISLSHKILSKNENAVYRLQISALVPAELKIVPSSNSGSRDIQV